MTSNLAQFGMLVDIRPTGLTNRGVQFGLIW